MANIVARVATWFRGTFGFGRMADLRPLPPPSERVGSERIRTFRVLAAYGDVATTITAVVGMSALAYHVWSGAVTDTGERKRSVNRTLDTIQSMDPDLARIEGSAIRRHASGEADIWKSALQDAHQARARQESTARASRDRT